MSRLAQKSFNIYLVPLLAILLILYCYKDGQIEIKELYVLDYSFIFVPCHMNSILTIDILILVDHHRARLCQKEM